MTKKQMGSGININPANKGKLTTQQKKNKSLSKSGKPTVAGDNKILNNPKATTKQKREAAFDKARRSWKHK